MTNQISVYARSVVSTIDGNTNRVTLDEIDPGNVLAEFTERERLESVELSVVYDYIRELENE